MGSTNHFSCLYITEQQTLKSEVSRSALVHFPSSCYQHSLPLPSELTGFFYSTAPFLILLVPALCSVCFVLAMWDSKRIYLKRSWPS